MSYDEQWYLNTAIPKIRSRYSQAGVPLDDLYPIWPVRINEDINHGLSQDTSLLKHDIELCKTLGIEIPLWRPTRDEIRKFRGAFCIPNAFDYILFGDNKRIWTPATLCYDDDWQNKIINRFKDFYPDNGHFVINLGGSTYHNDYPHIPDNVSAARNLIIKLLQNQLIPVCCATDDEHPDVVLDSYATNADIIDCSFIMWEMNGPCQNDSNRMFNITRKCRILVPNSLTYLHFTAGHGSMGEPEGEWWKKCRDIGIQGLFSQDNGFDREGHKYDGDPVGTAAGLEDTAAHLHGQRAGWEGLNLDNVGFEQTTTPVYHKYSGWDGIRQKQFGDYLLKHCPGISGVCDGHSSDV